MPRPFEPSLCSFLLVAAPLALASPPAAAQEEEPPRSRFPTNDQMDRQPPSASDYERGILPPLPAERTGSNDPDRFEDFGGADDFSTPGDAGSFDDDFATPRPSRSAVGSDSPKTFLRLGGVYGFVVDGDNWGDAEFSALGSGDTVAGFEGAIGFLPPEGEAFGFGGEAMYRFVTPTERDEPFGEEIFNDLLLNLQAEARLGPIRPFVGGGGGFTFVIEDPDTADIYEDTLGFAAQAVAGFRSRLSDNLQLELRADYTYRFIDQEVTPAFSSFDGETVDADLDNLSLVASVVITF